MHNSETEKPQPFLSHLIELRQRLILIMATWLVAFGFCYRYAQQLFEWVAVPVREALPAGSTLVFIQATEPFFTYLKVAAVAALLVALPVIVWQFWMFVAPALYPGEQRLVLPFVLCSCLCFATGTYFGFNFVFPVIFTFLINYGIAATGIQAMLSMSGYLSMASQLLLAFGLVFELPIFIFFLARLGVVDARWLARQRRYAILTAFVVGAVLTPPDIFSQLSIALPFILLYEFGIVIARLFGKKV